MDYKEALYHFRKFLIKEGIICEYSKHSRLGLFARCGIRDIPKSMRIVEPVKYIQNATFFCNWPDNGVRWNVYSAKWAEYCLENTLYYDKDEAVQYANDHVFRSLKYG